MRIYIASKMRGLPHNGFAGFDQAERELRHKYPDAEIINPASFDRQAGFDGSHEADSAFMREALQRDCSLLCDATHIALFGDWKNSAGATAEYYLALALGLGVIERREGGFGWQDESYLWRGTGMGNHNPAPHENPPTPRKHIPVASGVLDYFPDAIRAVAHCSWVGNEQHNSGEPLHWSRDKSNDHADCMMRHFMERGTVDEDGVRHSTKAVWRALALLQLEIEGARDE